MYSFVIVSSIFIGGLFVLSSWGQELKRVTTKRRRVCRQKPHDSLGQLHQAPWWTFDVVVMSNGQFHRVLVAAILSKAGHRVMLLENQPTVGRKVVQGKDTVSFDVSLKCKKLLSFICPQTKFFCKDEEILFDDDETFLKRPGKVLDDLDTRFPYSESRKYVKHSRSDWLGSALSKCFHFSKPKISNKCKLVLDSGIETKYDFVGGTAPIIYDLIKIIRENGGEIYTKTSSIESVVHKKNYFHVKMNGVRVPIVTKNYFPVIERKQPIFIGTLEERENCRRVRCHDGVVEIKNNYAIVRTTTLETAKKILERLNYDVVTWSTTEAETDDLDVELNRATNILYSALKYNSIERAFRNIENEIVSTFVE